MPSADSKVKDKYIRLSGNQFQATVEYYRDRPSRDKDDNVGQAFETLKDAQAWLDTFPRDAWDGYTLSDYNYAEIDERKKHVRLNKTAAAFSIHGDRDKKHGKHSLSGRTIAGPIRGTK
jgi:hypothetical protein